MTLSPKKQVHTNSSNRSHSFIDAKQSYTIPNIHTVETHETERLSYLNSATVNHFVIDRATQILDQIVKIKDILKQNSYR